MNSPEIEFIQDELGRTQFQLIQKIDKELMHAYRMGRADAGAPVEVSGVKGLTQRVLDAEERARVAESALATAKADAWAEGRADTLHQLRWPTVADLANPYRQEETK